MSYRKKRDDETWNQYLLHIFREKGEVNFIHFCNKYFNEERTLEYRAGLKEEKEEKAKIEKEVKKEPEKKKTSFAKKPKRLKAKKGYLF